MKRAGIAVTVVLAIISIFFLVKLRDFLETIYTPQTPNDSIFSLPLEKEKTTFNFILLGYGGGRHAGGLLTDSMMIAHVNTKENLAVLISIPRDLWVTLSISEKREMQSKINTAYSVGTSDKSYPNKPKEFTGEVGGGNMAKFAVEQVTGLPIDYYVALDFNGFTNVIDTLGGVDIVLDRSLDDYEYPIEGAEDDLCGKTEEELPELEKIATISAVEAFPCRYEHIHFDAGLNRLDGEQALKLVRSRHGIQDGTDFGRSARQQRMLLAVYDKVLNIGFIPKVVPLMDSLKGNLRTDIPYEVIKKLLKEQDDAEEYEVRNLVLSDKNFLKSSVSLDRQYILIPKEGEVAWDRIHQWMEIVTVSSKKSVWPQIALENGTLIEGLAQQAVLNLASRGLNVSEPTNAKLQNQEFTVIVVNNPEVPGEIITELQHEFNTERVLYQESTDELYDIAITVGEDYERSLRF